MTAVHDLSAEEGTNAFKEFVKEVKDSSFPDKEHSYSMSPSEISKFKQYLKMKNKI